MENSADMLKLGAGVIITAILVALLIFYVNKGSGYFNAQTSAVTDVISDLEDVTERFDNKVVSGEDVIIDYQQYGSDFIFMVQTCWMKKNDISAYQYGGSDSTVSRSAYCDEKSMYYFSKESNYTSTLIEQDGEVVGFLFVQMEG